MAKTPIEQQLADLAQWAEPTFKPAPMPEVSRWAGRRRLRRRAMVATGLATVIVVSAVALTLPGRRDGEPIIGPTATATPGLPTPGVPSRRVEVPGGLWAGQRFMLEWADRDNGWLFADCAAATNQVDCTYTLARTRDRGRTWRRVALPEAVKGQVVYLNVADADTLFIVEPGKGLWMTKDAGLTYSHSTFDNGPAIEWSQFIEGPYHMQCDNRQHWDQTKDTGECKFKRLVKSGLGPAPHQPPWTGLDTRVVGNGPDGRIWLAHKAGLAVSADEGKTWTETNHQAGNQLAFSPNGKYVYDNVNTEHWHLSGTTWRRVTVPLAVRHSNTMLPLDDGRLVVGNALTIGLLDGDVFTPLAGVVNAEPVTILRDGTVVLHYQGDAARVPGLYLGVPQGRGFDWVLLTY